MNSVTRSTINALTREQLSQHLDSILAIDEGTPGEAWNAENFFFDLPEKWHLSLLASSQSDIIGFLIASLKANVIHIHRLAVNRVFQNSGIGKNLVETLTKMAGDRQVQAITLKVAKSNIKALGFYTKLGFFIKADEGFNYLMEFKLN